MGAQHLWLGWEPCSGDPQCVFLQPSMSPTIPSGFFPLCSYQCPSSQHRGLVVVADKTELLYQQGYWASYNVP